MKSKQSSYNSWSRRWLYAFTFIKYGVLLNPINGRLKYLPFSCKCKCNKLQIMRHGKTIGVEKREFMSDTSYNSKLSDNGKKDVEKVARKIEEDFPDVVIVSTLNRTVETFNVLKSCLSIKCSVKYFDEMKGINNGIWAGKKFEMLNEKDLLIFLERECIHNVLVKTPYGDSWADVIYRCTKVLKIINRLYPNKKVLLISQGSIYQALKILLHIDNTPWESYSALKMFNIKDSSPGDTIGYSCLIRLQ